MLTSEENILELQSAHLRTEKMYVPIYSLRLVRAGTLESPARIVEPADAHELVRPYFDGLAQEHMIVLALDTQNRVLAVIPIYVGSVHTTVVRMAELLRPVLMTHATGLIVVHNHPGGDPTPSEQDIALTAKLGEACETVDIELVDHIVAGEGSFCSLRAMGVRW